MLLEMVVAADDDSLQNLFLDNRYLIDLLFALRNLDILVDFSKTLLQLRATDKAATNFKRVSAALKKMHFVDFLMHCTSLNIDEVDQTKVQKKYQLIENCWKIIDRGAYKFILAAN
jgi:hypothetical protein